jgi:hypothetical protein
LGATVKFQFKTKTKRLNGQWETKTQDFESDVVIVGRGGKSDVLVRSMVVSLEHARFSLDGNNLFVEDLSTISGVLVNGHPVGKAKDAEPGKKTGKIVKAGNTITLGDVELLIGHEGDVWSAEYEKVEEQRTDSAQHKEQRIKGVSIQDRFPSMFAIAFAATSLVVAFFAIAPWDRDRTVWNTGPITSQHQMISGSCESCHAEPFVKVRDQECRACHNVTNHDDHLAATPGSEPRCAECHMDHNGSEGMILRETELCTDCHVNPKASKPDATAMAVADFDSHPEFRVPVGALGEGGKREKISLDQKEKMVDPTRLKLNHALHLQRDLRGPDGSPVTLACGDCHTLSENYSSIKKISFEDNCQSCHSLGFDDRLPGEEVPHGDSDTVYSYVYAEYAKYYLLDDNGKPQSPEFDLRRKPGFQTAGASKSEQTAFAKQVIEDEARAAEKLLFTKTACFLCHDVSEKTNLDDSALPSHFEVVKPNVPERWLPESLFGHGAHEEIDCLSCHQDVRSSEKTTDVLLPKIETCRACHIGTDEPGKVRSDCITCHSYHDSEPLSAGSKRKIEEIVRSLPK